MNQVADEKHRPFGIAVKRDVDDLLYDRLDAELFVHFANQRVPRVLAWLDLASGKLPGACQVRARFPLCQKHAAVLEEDPGAHEDGLHAGETSSLLTGWQRSAIAREMAITYRQAGVDNEEGDRLVDRIAPLARATRIAEVISDVGGFAGLCRVPAGLREPVLVAGTDGVGTKLKVAFATGVHDTIGIDLVAMCVNDIITTGARPLFFLDYFVTGRLDLSIGESVVRGIAEGCRQSGCALLGGETAIHPDMYPDGEYDLAGFAVGVVSREKLLDGSNAKAGDALVAVASSGLHSNGYSLARKVFEGSMRLGVHDHLAELGVTVGEALLTPTRIYARAVAALLEAGLPVRSFCHVTGGGIPGNLPRVLPDNLGARVDLKSYTRPDIFDVLARGGPVDEDEMRGVYNLGVGLVAVVDREAADRSIEVLCAAGERAWVLGEVAAVAAGTKFEERVAF